MITDDDTGQNQGCSDSGSSQRPTVVQKVSRQDILQIQRPKAPLRFGENRLPQDNIEPVVCFRFFG